MKNSFEYEQEIKGLREDLRNMTDLATSRGNRVDALREELAERKRKHLRSCQLAIGKSQLAKERHAQLIEAEATRTSWQNGYEVKCQNVTMLAVERNGFQRRLTAAEQRNAELEGLLRDALEYYDDGIDCECSTEAKLLDALRTALKPIESGASE